MNDDIISKQAAIDALNAEGITKNMRAHRRILSLPSAERRGRWIVKHGVIEGDGIYGDMGECSVCGLHLRNYDWDYCPNCGAKMEGVAENG